MKKLGWTCKAISYHPAMGIEKTPKFEKTSRRCGIPGLIIGLIVYMLGLTAPAWSATEVSGAISTDIIWSDPVYHVTDSVSVDAGVTLTISPGSVVKFDYGKFLNVYGTLDAQGTDGGIIYFTDIRDDTVGGDSNGDGNDTAPEVPWWQGIYVRANGSAILDRIEVRYAGRYYQYYEPGALYKTGDGTLSLTNSSIRHSDRRAIVLKDTTGAHVIENNLIDGVRQYQGLYLRDASGNPMISGNLIVNAANSGIYARGDSHATITGNTVRDSGHSEIVLGGGTSNTGDVMISGNTVEGSAYHGIYLSNATGTVTVADNTIRYNGNNGIYIVRCSPFVTDNIIHDNANIGIYLVYSNPAIHRNHLYNNDIGIYCHSADPLIGGSEADSNDIQGNTTYGVQNITDTIMVDARYNWWGDVGGPSHSTNPGGQGDPVSDYVDFGSYLSVSVLNPPSEYNLAVSKDGDGGGTVTSDPAGIECGATCSADFNAGTEITLSAATDTGSMFSGWGGDCSGTETTTGVTLDAAKSCTAAFTLNQYTVTPAADTGGSIEPSTPQMVSHGTTTSFTVTPDDGYGIAAVDGTCGGSLSGSTYTTDAITGDCTVTASFAINMYTLTYIPGDNGSITGDSPQIVAHGANGSMVTAVPDEGYHFVQWSDGSTANPRTDTGVTGDIVVTASFAINEYTLTYIPGSNSRRVLKQRNSVVC